MGRLADLLSEPVILADEVGVGRAHPEPSGVVAHDAPGEVDDGAEFEQAFLGVTPWGLRRLYVMLDIESPRRGSGNSFQMARVSAASCGSDDLQILKSAIKDPQAIGLPSVGVWRTLE